jgi:hypothetical protein
MESLQKPQTPGLQHPGPEPILLIHPKQGRIEAMNCAYMLQQLVQVLFVACATEHGFNGEEIEFVGIEEFVEQWDFREGFQEPFSRLPGN